MEEEAPISTMTKAKAKDKAKAKNVVAVFVARFDTRRGNMLEWQYPAGVELRGVEYKVLPSGGHLVSADVVYLAHPRGVGVAVFRNARRDGAERGARMVAVGAVLATQEGAAAAAAAHQAAIVPHLPQLERLADMLIHNPAHTQPLRAFYDAHMAPAPALSPESESDRADLHAQGEGEGEAHHPRSHLPAMCAALGPLLPVLLKLLMSRGHRLLIYTPAPPLRYAAYIGYNLADLASPAPAPGPVRIRGQIGVHDIPDLPHAPEPEPEPGAGAGGGARSWVAWSSDRILLDKLRLFDSVLDLSGDEASLRSVRDGRLCTHRWTAREWSTFTQLDAHAQRLATATHPAPHPHPAPTATATATATATVGARAGLLSTLLVFLRYVLAGWWFLPQHWRNGLPAAHVLPLGIRGDGGVRSSIMLLPDSESESDTESESAVQDDDDDDDSQEGSVSPDPDPDPDPDPLLAAAGAGGASRSGSVSLHDDASPSPSPSPSPRLSLAETQWTVWSRWTRALVDGLAALLPPDSDADSPRAPVTISTRDMAALGLSAANAADVQLVHALAAVPVHVSQPWPLLGWLL